METPQLKERMFADPVFYLHDFINEIVYKIVLDEGENVIHKETILTVEERYSNRNDEFGKELKEAIKECPEVVRQIDELVGKLNEVENAEEYKKLVNEFKALVKGKPIY